MDLVACTSIEPNSSEAELRGALPPSTWYVGQRPGQIFLGKCVISGGSSPGSTMA